MKLYGCCDDPACPYCFGSGLVSGPEADAFYSSLETLLEKRMLENILSDVRYALEQCKQARKFPNSDDFADACVRQAVDALDRAELTIMDAIDTNKTPDTKPAQSPRSSSENPKFSNLSKQPNLESAEDSNGTSNEADIPF